jgi:hypothetical protein
MTLAYGYVKTKVTSEPKLKPSHHGHETQYHLHCNLSVDGGTWDVAVNVGTNTGKWRDSDVMDGSDAVEPAGSLKRLLSRARQNNLDVYIFGRFYDVHLNQGSTKSFVHRPGDDSNDHNGRRISRRSTSNWCRPTSSAIRCRAGRRFERTTQFAVTLSCRIEQFSSCPALCRASTSSAPSKRRRGWPGQARP